jgi:hypothetical protein
MKLCNENKMKKLVRIMKISATAFSRYTEMLTKKQ